MASFNNKLNGYLNYDSLRAGPSTAPAFNIASLSKHQQKRILKASQSQVRSIKSYLYNSKRELDFKNKKYNKAHIEWHRKFSLSFACIVMFLIGAPLGAIIRKGGMGMPVLISILFFLVYHIISITGEKSALQGVVSVFEGMWASAIFLSPLGLFLTYKANNDRPLFNFSFSSNLFKKKV
jgi:lipopolysaccharide export system permease protein